jgi:hypothetical protein
VAKATVSPAAQRKAASKRTEDGHPVHSFRTLLTDLATMTQNTVRYGANLDTAVLATPTALQKTRFRFCSGSRLPQRCSHKIATHHAQTRAILVYVLRDR